MNNKESSSNKFSSSSQSFTYRSSKEVDFNQLFSRNAIVSNIRAEGDYYLIEASMLTNKEFCTACAEGRGCGAVYLNDLSPIAKAKKKVTLTLDQETMARDKLAIGDVIKVATKKSNFLFLIMVFYLLPSLIFIFSTFLFSETEVSAIVQALIVLTLITLYFLSLKFLLKSKEASVYYLHLEHRGDYREASQSNNDNNASLDEKNDKKASEREFKGKIKEL